MVEIKYQTFDCELINQVIKIYEKNGWTAYIADVEKLKRSFYNSLYILGAFDNGLLVGFIRCVGDGEHIVFIQDLIVDPNYYRRGIGENLYNLVSHHFKDVRTFLLITDADDTRSNSFYQAMGMTDNNKICPLKTYIR